MLSSEVIGMRPVTIKNHPDLPLTATHMRGSQPGQVLVDEVWATDDLPVDMAGWLAFHKCPGDHRVVMIKINTEVLLGDELLRITHPQRDASLAKFQGQRKTTNAGLSHTSSNIRSLRDSTGSMPP
jgi:hypothetical protein